MANKSMLFSLTCINSRKDKVIYDDIIGTLASDPRTLSDIAVKIHLVLWPVVIEVFHTYHFLILHLLFTTAKAEHARCCVSLHCLFPKCEDGTSVRLSDS